MNTLESLFVKICGITNLEDAEFACKLGVSALGFVAYKKSKRYISSVDVHKITSKIIPAHPSVRLVGVFVDTEHDKIMEYAAAGINVVQLHGNESIEYTESLRKAIKHNNIELWRAIRLKSEKDIIAAKSFPADKFLVDSYTEDKPGGTGVVANWELAKLAVKILPKPVILAGGLTPLNVADAIKAVKPFGIDVSSGVETSPGSKNYNQIKSLMKALKHITT